jgi:hypothetical protein
MDMIFSTKTCKLIRIKSVYIYKKRRRKRKHTGKEEHISAMAKPTNQVKNVTTT